MKPTKPIDLIESLPMTDLVRIHNTLTANKVRKFENRTKAARRINDLLKCQKLWFEQAAAAAGVITTEEAEARIKEIQETEAKLADDGWNDPMPPGSKGRGQAAPQENPDPTDPIHEDELTEQEQQAEQTRQEAEDEPKSPIFAHESDSLVLVVTSDERFALHRAIFNAIGEDHDTVTSLLDKLRNAMPTTRVTAPEKAARPAKPRTTNPRENGMTVNQRKIIELCERPEGATGKELAEGCGWPSIAARATCQKLADRFGYTLTEKPKTAGRGISFYLTPET
jgi:hypothetical protein